MAAAFSTVSLFPNPVCQSHLRRRTSTISANPLIARSLRSRVLSPQLGSISIAAPRFRRIPISTLAFDSGGGSGGGSGSIGGGGGGDGPEGGEPKIGEVIGATDDVSALSPDVIVLDVGGMSCGGCAGKVKRILESQPQVSSANVILATETAIVWPVPDAKSESNWREEIGEMLAKHLTSCGFQSKLRGLENIEEQVSQ